MAYLRNLAKINPLGKDMNELMAACLIRVGAVAPGFTAKDYVRGYPTQDFPFLDLDKGRGLLYKCDTNPNSSSVE